MRVSKALSRLCECLGLSETLLLAYRISTKSHELAQMYKTYLGELMHYMAHVFTNSISVANSILLYFFFI